MIADQNIYVCFTFFSPTVLATSFSQRPKFVRAENLATAKGEDCAYGPTLFIRNYVTPMLMLMCLSAALHFRPVLLPFFEITQLICYIKSTFNDLTDIIFFCSHKFIQLYLSDYLQTLHGTFLKICTFIFVSWSIAIWFNLVVVKFIYSEKATKICEISTVDLTGTT